METDLANEDIKF